MQQVGDLQCLMWRTVCHCLGGNRQPLTQCTRTKVSSERPEVDTPPQKESVGSVPTDSNLARTSPRKPRTTTVSPERPEIDRGHLSPSWSVLLAAPRSVGPDISLGYPIDPQLARSVGPTENGSDNTLVPPGMCGTWPLLALWDPRFFGLTTAKSAS